jgi:hypothetical protein
MEVTCSHSRSPDGSPTHPAYPTGHGTVGGACITVLKFFFDGTTVLNNPQMPNHNGTASVPWTGQPGAAISFLHDLACTYAEPFNITITKLDGVTTETFTNM